MRRDVKFITRRKYYINGGSILNIGQVFASLYLFRRLYILYAYPDTAWEFPIFE